MNPLYNTGIRLYRLGVKAAAMRSEKPRLMLEGHRKVENQIKEFRNRIGNRKLVWVHAASLGEFEQGRPMIDRLKKVDPKIAILLTFFSPSGYEVRKNYIGADCVCYLPFDTPENVTAFLDTVKPDMAVFVKYEFWGNFLNELKKRKVPTFLISAIFRKNQPFFKFWGSMFRQILKCYTHIYVQDENSRKLLESIGIDNVTVAGDTRFDRVTDVLKNASPIDTIERWKESNKEMKCLIAGSSWPEDEDVYIPWIESRDDIITIIAPHEFDKERLIKLKERIGSDHTALYSEVHAPGAKIDPSIKVIIIDCFGLLSSLYRYAELAYVGGGFGAGIHNVAEAAVYGVPVLFGPNHEKFREAKDLKECGGGFAVDSPESFKETAEQLIDNPIPLEAAGKAAGNYIKSSLGATDRIIASLKKMMFSN